MLYNMATIFLLIGVVYSLWAIIMLSVDYYNNRD